MVFISATSKELTLKNLKSEIPSVDAFSPQHPFVSAGYVFSSREDSQLTASQKVQFTCLYMMVVS